MQLFVPDINSLLPQIEIENGGLKYFIGEKEDTKLETFEQLSGIHFILCFRYQSLSH